MKHDGDVQKVKHVCVGYRQTHLYFIVDNLFNFLVSNAV